MGREIPMMNAIFACAMVNQCTLNVAAGMVGASNDDLWEAVKYRCNTATGGADGKGKWFNDYHESIYEAFKRLETSN